jgi:AAHS family 4-hydroxybenzoate transporter-like MFS transporter
MVGIGLGAVLPNALVLAGELAPARLQASAAGLAGIGITLGGVLAGVASAQLLPEFGWRSLFIVGGMLPVAVTVALVYGLPESPEMAPRITPAESQRRAVWDLVRPPFLATTIRIWALFALVLMTVYLLGGWIPLLMSDAGFSKRDGAYVAASYHLGGALGAMCAAILLRFMRWTVVASFAFAGVAVLAALATGAGAGTGVALTTLVIAAGFCVTGAQNAANGSTSSAYPASIRAAGLGWALGFGRFGSVMGPLAGSWAMLLGFERPDELFAVAVAPMAVAGMISLGLRRAETRAIPHSPPPR